MELNERLKDEIAYIFKTVEYGRITFFISPAKDTLDYSVEKTDKIPLTGVAKKRLTKNASPF